MSYRSVTVRHGRPVASERRQLGRVRLDLTVTDRPNPNRWLQTDDVGGVDDTYAGTVLDARGVGNPEVTAGAEGTGGPASLDPSALSVSPEAIVKRVRTAHGHYNALSDPDTQLGESDLALSSGEPVERENDLYTQIFEQPARFRASVNHTSIRG